MTPLKLFYTLAMLIVFVALVRSDFKIKHRLKRSKLVSFDPQGEYVALGLDILLPFVNVPLKTKADDGVTEKVSKLNVLLFT